MNAAWGAQSDYGEITFFLAKHKTTDNIKHTKAFTVAFATKDTVDIADYFGVETGNNVNKIEKPAAMSTRVIMSMPRLSKNSRSPWNVNVPAMMTIRVSL